MHHRKYRCLGFGHSTEHNNMAEGSTVVKAEAAAVCNFLYIDRNGMSSVFNYKLISKPWYRYPHVGQQLHKT